MTAAAQTCSSCGADAPAGAHFCPSCGARLSCDAPGSTERRTVTTLFADLVGFTALGERHDPEDVDAVLRVYYEMARGVIERFGGTVEKFIGDAVAGVFGVPVAHEDDPERAVRAALAIVDGMEALEGPSEERLLVRVGVNTGRAVVRLDALLHAGEGALVGDAVNTAARLLEAAPPMGVAVGERTYALTARTILYEELSPVAAKGKSQPVRRWLAHGAVARRGIEDAGSLTPMIDREVELGILTGLVDKAVASQSPQFALIVGEAGIGKSRLVLEVFRALDARPGFLCTWRQGRCPPYGDGLSFWALREMVSAHAGVLQTDSPSAVEDKLERALGDGGANPWILSRLRPLVGLPAPESERDENFAAWLQFFEGLARARPTILVIEDVHWASEQTLAFLGYLAHHASDVPLVALGTARPEFIDAHPGFTRFADAVTRIDLKSLTEEESGRLASNLLGAAAVPDIAELVSARSGGNPLFTEELVRYVVERQTRRPDTGPRRAAKSPRQAATAVAAEAPDSIATLIAARLDALPADYRSLLADAAVVGPVFWPGAVSALGDRGAGEVEQALKELEAREFVRRHGESVLAGDEEFAFWHALTRDVAYEQLPRAARATKHAAVARWIESAAPRDADVAQVLAYHFWTAVQLAQSLGQSELGAELLQPALNALQLAGDHTQQLDLRAAEECYRHAAAIAPADDPSRPDILLAWTRVLHQLGQPGPALVAAEEAVAILRTAHRPRALALALAALSHCCDWVGDARAVPLVEEALRVAEASGPSLELLQVLGYWVADRSVALDYALAISTADRALSLSAQLKTPPPAKVIHYRGLSRCEIGDEEGLEDVRRSLFLARTQGLARELSDFSYNYAEQLRGYRGPRQALEALREGIEVARSRGNAAALGYLTLAELVDLWLLGDWPTFEARFTDLDALLREHHDTTDLALHRAFVALAHLAQGKDDIQSSEHELCEALEQVPVASPYPEVGQLACTVIAALRAGSNDMRSASRRLDSVVEIVDALGYSPGLALVLPEAARATTRETVQPQLLSVQARGLESRLTDTAASAGIRALDAETRSDLAAGLALFSEARDTWSKLEIPYETAHALLGQGRCLLALGRTQEATAPLAEAREIFARLGARPALAEAEVVIERAIGR